MVGNDLGRDVAGAHNAGLRAVWIERGASEGGPAATPDATIASLSELPALCAGIAD
jgi:putative hydrolase of the HAD superfamily